MQISDGIFVEGMEKTLLDVIKFIDIFFINVKTAMKLVKVFKIQICKAFPSPWSFRSAVTKQQAIDDIPKKIQRDLSSLTYCHFTNSGNGET
ncbi:hypothetical protein ElyMa_006779100 [Elysia marginata]|uniref:Uncharacterized protein n=1 Tax=Elysia marginata TaxID=1093978 RepID=A0AAV4IZ11_9GAST|nr:hypothetical protein ElyMa_006779100 [Elysia marginata]